MDNPSLISVPCLRDVVAKVAVIKHDTTQVRTKGNLSFYRCTVVVCAGGEKYGMEGKAAVARQAREAVWLRVLAKLYVRGKLESHQGPKSNFPAPNGNSAARGRDTIKNLWDVYRYCAMMGRLPVTKLRKDIDTGLLEYTIALDEPPIHVSGTYKTQANVCKGAIDAFPRAVKRSAVQEGPRNRIHTIFDRFKSQKDAANFLEWLTQHDFITLDVRNTARTSVEGARTPEMAGVTAE